MRYKKDDFNGGWYEPKSAPKYINQNGFYAYFNYKDDAVGPGSIWWTLQYHADDWLFIESYIFLIDGQQYTFTPTDPKRDSGNGGMIWEWFNEEAKANSQALEILNLLAKAKSAKVRIIGKDYRKDVNISELQRIEINRILKLHAALTTIHNS